MTKVVIMAGGLGTRLGEAAKETPKAMLEVNGKPILHHQIDILRNQGLTDIVLRVRHRKKQIMHYFGNGKQFGVNIEYFVVNRPYLRAVRSLNISDDYILMNGDLLFEADLKDMLHFHKRNDSYMTMGVTNVDDRSHYGAVSVRKSKVIGLHEKTESGKGLVNSGIYVISPQVDFSNHNNWLDFLVETVEMKKMYAYSKICNWIDIGSPESLESAREFWK
tara:strand:- start:1 stop:660 length:660 start_codon:yes stop_codon:yes gene_type:complete